MTLNLTNLKAATELAKTSRLNRDEWGEDIDPDDVLRLVEVARAALETVNARSFFYDGKAKLDELRKIMKGIEP